MLLTGFTWFYRTFYWLLMEARSPVEFSWFGNFSIIIIPTFRKNLIKRLVNKSHHTQVEYTWILNKKEVLLILITLHFATYTTHRSCCLFHSLSYTYWRLMQMMRTTIYKTQRRQMLQEEITGLLLESMMTLTSSKHILWQNWSLRFFVYALISMSIIIPLVQVSLTQDWWKPGKTEKCIENIKAKSLKRTV